MVHLDRDIPDLAHGSEVSATLMHSHRAWVGGIATGEGMELGMDPRPGLSAGTAARPKLPFAPILIEIHNSVRRSGTL
jgi:hypothetical protein